MQPPVDANGDGAGHQAPQINLLLHESRCKAFGGGLAVLLRRNSSPLSLNIAQGEAGAELEAPEFRLLSHEPRRKAIKGGLATFFRRTPPQRALIVCRDEVAGKDRPKLTALFSSCLLHFSIFIFVLEVPFSLLFLHEQTSTLQLPQIVYQFQEIELPKDLPAVKPPGPGGQPGKGTHPERAPAKGSTAFHRKATVVSNPPHPDNNFQTIIQPHVPAAQKITIALRLPNIVLGGTLTVPAPPPKIPPPPPMKLSLPKTLNSLTIPQSTVVSLKAPDLQLPPSEKPDMPAIPAPPPPPPPKAKPQPAKPKVVIATLGIQAVANGAGASLLSLSLNPAPPTDKLVLPAGNRYGAFTISPAGTKPGSPNGNTGGSPTGGSGGPGGGGDSSTGVGSNFKGGGGGGAGRGGLAVSASGNAGSAGAAKGGRLSASTLAKLVYPILRPPPKNRFAMVITAGPVGGGGLHIFGVLKGGKVYTVFLPMPGKDWILQYCALHSADSRQDPKTRGVAVQLSFGLVPPAVEKRFNFHHPTLPADPKSKMIVLHGTIGKDGHIHGLTVYRGVQNVADQAALAAFARWKFAPALRNGKPVAIEILLGIPLA